MLQGVRVLAVMPIPWLSGGCCETGTWCQVHNVYPTRCRLVRESLALSGGGYALCGGSEGRVLI